MIYFGVTTTPERLEKRIIHSAIRSILGQIDQSGNPIPLKVIVNIPKTSLKGIKYDYEIADEISKISSRVIVQFGVTDYGPITKLIPTLEYIENKNAAWVGLIDDDIIFSNNRLYTLLSQIQRNDLAIGFSGRSVPLNLVYNDHYIMNKRCDSTPFLQTFGMVLYDPNVFGKVSEFKKWFSEIPREYIFVDDIIIGAFLDKKDVNRVIIAKKNTKYKSNDQYTEKMCIQNVSFRDFEAFEWFKKHGYYTNFKIPIIDNIYEVTTPILKKVMSAKIVSDVMNNQLVQKITDSNVFINTQAVISDIRSAFEK